MIARCTKCGRYAYWLSAMGSKLADWSCPWCCEPTLTPFRPARGVTLSMFLQPEGARQKRAALPLPLGDIAVADTARALAAAYDERKAHRLVGEVEEWHRATLAATGRPKNREVAETIEELIGLLGSECDTDREPADGYCLQRARRMMARLRYETDPGPVCSQCSEEDETDQQPLDEDGNPLTGRKLGEHLARLQDEALDGTADTLVNPNGTTTCCGAMTSIGDAGQFYCKKCYELVVGHTDGTLANEEDEP